jgi:hypothetical protein
MGNLLSADPLALSVLMTEDLYLIKGEALDASRPAAATEKEEEPAPAEPAIPARPEFNFMGQNNRFILMLVDEPGHEHASPATIDALGKILGGKGQSFDDIALVNLSKYQALQYPVFQEFFACSQVVFFGVDPRSLGLPAMAANSINSFDGVKILYSFSFDEMNADVQKKKAFWNEMKKL